MFEVGMSKFVQDICKEYAQKNGYNFPPNTQQMINAIVQWVTTQAIRDIKTIRVLSHQDVKDGIEYTMEVEYAKGEPTTFTFTAPNGVGIKSVKIIEVSE